MNKNFKKVIAAVMAAATLTVGTVGMSASATPWEASHTYTPSVPSSGNNPDKVAVYHMGNGATAICNYNAHTSASADKGTTKIECLNYSMTTKKIINTGSVICNPDVGTPITDIYVRYQVSALTAFAYDTFTTKGNIN